MTAPATRAFAVERSRRRPSILLISLLVARRPGAKDRVGYGEREYHAEDLEEAGERVGQGRVQQEDGDVEQGWRLGVLAE